MEWKDIFDVVSHVFALFPLTLLYISIQHKSSSKYIDYLIFILILVTLVFSIGHHSDRSNAFFKTADMTSVGILLIAVILIYLDHVENMKVRGSVIIVVIVVLYILAIYVDSNAIDSSFSFTTLIAGVVLFFGIAYLIFKIRKKPEYNTNHLWTAVFYAVFACIFFVLPSDNFYMHSLWHMYVFIALGFAVLFVIDKQCTDANESNVKSNVKSNKIKKTLYALSLTVRAYTVFLYFYAGYVDDKVVYHLAWTAYAILTAVLFLVLAVCIQNNKNPIAWCKSWCKKQTCTTPPKMMQKYGYREMYLHALLWAVAAVSFQVLYDTDVWWLAGACLLLDLVLSVTLWIKRKQEYSTETVKMGSGKGFYADLEIPKRYRKNTLRF
ncbi:MAG: hypothetical protein CME58_12620 [Halieaceae bacterium]|nr:hypothetical protein [Halieaceae bacterium]|tara:strand:+ start:3357 stop:4499 length:1143 start_codon:yes stop_codon:yes gene_type:complete